MDKEIQCPICNEKVFIRIAPNNRDEYIGWHTKTVRLKGELRYIEIDCEASQHRIIG